MSNKITRYWEEAEALDSRDSRRLPSRPPLLPKIGRRFSGEALGWLALATLACGISAVLGAYGALKIRDLDIAKREKAVAKRWEAVHDRTVQLDRMERELHAEAERMSRRRK